MTRGTAKRSYNGRTEARALRTIAPACLLAIMLYAASGIMVSPSTASPGPEELLYDALSEAGDSAQAEPYVAPVSRGQALYSANCLPCHGEAGSSVAGVDLGSAGYLRMLADGRTISAIYGGTDAMPGFGVGEGGGLNVLDVAALLAYIKVFSSDGL